MNMPPAILTYFLIVLVGWPALKLGATLLARPIWVSQRQLKADLLSDFGGSEDAARCVKLVFEAGKGTALQLILPVVAFFASMAVVFDRSKFPAAVDASSTSRTYLAHMRSPSECARRLVQDPRFDRLDENAFQLAMYRYPVCTIMVVIAVIPAIVTVLILSGFRASWKRVATTLATSSREAVLAFEQSFSGFC